MVYGSEYCLFEAKIIIYSLWKYTLLNGPNATMEAHEIWKELCGGLNVVPCVSLLTRRGGRDLLIYLRTFVTLRKQWEGSV